MKKILASFAFLFVFICNTPFVGAEKANRIIGGDVSDSETPWMVALVEKNGLQDDEDSEYYLSRKKFHEKTGNQKVTLADGTEGYQFCGGVLIDSGFVLSAAHCLEGVDNARAGDIVALINAYDLSKSASEDGREEIPLADFLIHPEYLSLDDFPYAEENQARNDNALLKLSTRSQNTPIEMYSQELTGKENFSALGWGVIDDESSPNILYKVSGLKNIPRELAESLFHEFSGDSLIAPEEYFIATDEIVAGSIFGGKDTCYGDSGGPLVIFLNRKYQLVGLTSWGYSCAAKGLPGVYAKISKILIDLTKNNGTAFSFKLINMQDIAGLGKISILNAHVDLKNNDNISLLQNSKGIYTIICNKLPASFDFLIRAEFFKSITGNIEIETNWNGIWQTANPIEVEMILE